MELIAILCLLAAGYFGVLKIVLAKAQNPSAYRAVTLLVLGLYLCTAGFVWILYESLGSGGLMLYAGSLLYAVCFLPFFLFQCIRFQKEIQYGAFVTLLLYLCAVFYITVFSRDGSGNTVFQMEIFGWIKRCITLESYNPAKHFLQNLALFIPVGILLFLAHQKKLGSLTMSVSFAISISVLIETIQFFGGIGSCDVDDILSNTMGAFVGVLLGKVLIYFRILPEEESNFEEAEIS
jgi:glycopeptide antibiotics resistance protein